MLRPSYAVKLCTCRDGLPLVDIDDLRIGDARPEELRALAAVLLRIADLAAEHRGRYVSPKRTSISVKTPAS
ncbi:MAG: hypothetical protein ABS84_15575 [Rubrivivax sp. SCN 71-131]|nr:MAG: hypothetical protein ABS84_15575 [Rubrivivax sp. SCN 71-131]